jgi:hypothetical protein
MRRVTANPAVLFVIRRGSLPKAPELLAARVLRATGRRSIQIRGSGVYGTRRPRFTKVTNFENALHRFQKNIAKKKKALMAQKYNATSQA